MPMVVDSMIGHLRAETQLSFWFIEYSIISHTWFRLGVQYQLQITKKLKKIKISFSAGTEYMQLTTGLVLLKWTLLTENSLGEVHAHLQNTL